MSNPSSSESSESGPPVALTEQAIKGLITKGDEALSRRAYSDAQVQYALAIKEQPDNIDLLYKLAIVHYEKDSFDVAAELLRSILDKNAAHVGAYEMLGIIYLKNENVASAEENLNKALNLDSNRWRSLNAMGIVKDMQSEHASAQQHFQQALLNSPNKAQTENNLGYSYYLSGSYQEAEQHFRKATQLNPGYEKAWANLGLVFVRIKQYEDARYAFSKVVEDHVVSNNLGYLSMLQGDEEMARQELARAVLIAPTYYPKASENMVSLNTQNTTSDLYSSTEINQSLIENDDTELVSTLNAVASTHSIASELGVALESATANVAQKENAGETENAHVIIKESTYVAPVNTNTMSEPATVIKKNRNITSSASGKSLSQYYLNLLGHQVHDGSDSLYYPLLGFQVSHQLEPTGVMDSTSFNLLKSEAIRSVKSLLISLDYPIDSQSSGMDVVTVKSIKQYQANNSLPVSGLLDKRTLVSLTRYSIGEDVAVNAQQGL